MFLEMARNQAIRNKALRWLATSEDEGAKWEREFYSVALARLAAHHKRQILHICVATDQSEVEAVLSELLAHELMWRLGVDPVWHPSLKGQTPDLMFRSGGQDFVETVL